MESGLLSKIKNRIVSSHNISRTIKWGVFRGIRMEIDLTNNTQLYLGLFEREIYKWLKEFSKGINTAIDIGAANGEYTLYYLIKTSAKKIWAFERSNSARKSLIANLRLNNLEDSHRLKIFPKSVYSRDGEDSCSLDSLIPDISLPCLIKMDVDGLEGYILQGATKLLNLSQIYWIIETHSKDLENECISVLTANGFETKIVPNAWWRIIIPEQRPGELNRWLIATKS